MMISEIINIKIPQTMFGAGAINNLGDVAKGFAPNKILVVTDTGLTKTDIISNVTSQLEKAGFKPDVFDKCGIEAPISGIEELAAKVKNEKYDLLVGVGGGSNIDTTKAASILAANDGVTIQDLIDDNPVEKSVSKIIVPTTAGTGSEWSIVAVITNDDDRTYLGGSNIPEMVYGFSGGFNYRGFDFVFIFQGAARVVQKLEGEAVWAFYNGGKVMEEWLDRWTPDNPGAKYPRVMITAPNNQLSSSFWLRDASYLRLKNLEIGYTFPSNLGHRMGISKIRIYSNGVNLLTYSPLKNVDPENIDLKGWYYPQQKLVNFGINVEF